VVIDFDSADKWEPVQGQTANPLNDQVRTVAGPAGAALELAWRPIQGQPLTHGVRPKSNSRPLAVIASDAFLERSRMQVGDKSSAFIGASFLEIEIVDSFHLFPTLADSREEPAAVANGNHLTALINANPRSTLTYPDEAWLETGSDSVVKVRRAIESGAIQATAVSFEEIRTAQQKDPLVAAGWEGILFISFAAILLLSSIGFLIYSYLTAQKRTLEFAVLRTMGFSRRQIATVVGFEQAFVVGMGMIAGTLMGMRLGRLMIRYMGVTETGDDVLPPMLLHVSWFTVGSAWLMLGVAFLLTIGIVVLLYSRLALHRVLRIGET
jgi:ABC-type antimicrobial peptide transport system permease subunit